jgi:hypothetical protein
MADPQYRRPGRPEDRAPACPADVVVAAMGDSIDGAARPARGMRRVVYVAVGGTSLATGVVGMFVPLLPTTCFLLLAAWCFARSSPALHHWMHHNRWFGTYLRDYRAGRGIPRRIKAGSLAVLWGTIALSLVVAVKVWWVAALLLGVAVAVTAHVVTLKDTPAPT